MLSDITYFGILPLQARTETECPQCPPVVSYQYQYAKFSLSSPGRYGMRDRHHNASIPGDMDNFHVLSLSGTSNLHYRHPSASTKQQKKISADHQLMAFVTAKTSEKMVQTLQDMT